MPFYEEDLDEDEGRETAEALDRALTATPHGLAEFHPRPAWGSDPSQLGWPATLPIELAMKTGTPRSICASYGIEREEWDILRTNPAFIDDLTKAAEMVRTEGGSFKARSQLQAQEYLKEAWRLVHDPGTPPAVRADLIKSTVKWAGLDASRDQAGGKPAGSGFQINIILT